MQPPTPADTHPGRPLTRLRAFLSPRPADALSGRSETLQDAKTVTEKASRSLRHASVVTAKASGSLLHASVVTAKASGILRHASVVTAKPIRSLLHGSVGTAFHPFSPITA